MFMFSTFAFIWATKALAFFYTDPGSGLLIWQLLLAAFFGAAFYLRKVFFWRNNKLAKAKKEQSEADK